MPPINSNEEIINIKNKNISLKTRLIIYLTLAITVCAGISIYFNFKILYQYISNNEIQSLQNLIRVDRGKIEEAMSEASIVTSSLAKDTNVINFLTNDSEYKEKNTPEIISLFNSYNKMNEYLAIYIMDTEGNTIISTDETFTGINFAFRNYFKSAKEGNTGLQADIGIVSKEFGYYFSAPIKNTDNTLIGILALKMNPQIVKDVLEKIKADSEASQITLIDNNNTIIYTDNKEKLFKNIGELNENKYNKILETKNFYQQLTTIKDPDNNKNLISISKIKETPYFIILESDMREVFYTITKNILNTSVITILASMLAILISSITVYNLLKPLKEIEKFAQEISSGNFLRLNTNRFKGEFKDISYALNEMSRKLKNMYKTMQESIEQKTQKIAIQLEEKQKSEVALMNILEDLDTQNKLIETRSNELQKFKMAVENTYDHIVITDTEGTVLYANGSVERITGFKKDEVIGTKAGVLWGKLMDKEFYEKMWKTIKNEKKTFTGSVKNHRKNGEVYEAHASISPVLNEKKEVIFYVGIERDITEEKNIDRMKTEFISLASHQLRTPLSAIRWYLEMLLNGDMGKLKEEQKTLVENVDKSNKRMIELVDALLDITRLESGKITVEPKPCNIADLLNEVLTDIGNRFKEKIQDIRVNIEPNIPITMIDPKLIRQVFLNLLTNANKYTQEKGQIEVTLKTGSNNKNLIFEVKDNGYGILEKDRAQIFAKFYRGQNIVKLETEGTGLGLYLVKIIVEASKGTVDFVSKENKGTTFTITLPIIEIVDIKPKDIKKISKVVKTKDKKTTIKQTKPKKPKTEEKIQSLI